MILLNVAPLNIVKTFKYQRSTIVQITAALTMKRCLAFSQHLPLLDNYTSDYGTDIHTFNHLFIVNPEGSMIHQYYKISLKMQFSSR